MKKCPSCKKTKKLSEFSKNKNRSGGYQSYCKLCFKIKYPAAEYYNKEARKKYYKKNKDEIIQNINKHNKNKDEGLYFKYWTMIRRCKYPSQKGYRWYGARGVRVEWKSYKEFKKDMYESYLKHLKKFGHKQTTIDRINGDKNYCKENCRWATWKEQVKNKKYKRDR